LAPTHIHPLHHHRGLSAVSSVRQGLGVLVEKELVHQLEEGCGVMVVFLGHLSADG